MVITAMIIEVTADLIKETGRRCDQADPITRAYQAVLRPDAVCSIEADRETVVIDCMGIRTTHNLPDFAHDWLCLYENGMQPQPFGFNADLPVCLLRDDL